LNVEEGMLDASPCPVTYTNLLNEGPDLYYGGKFWEGNGRVTRNADLVPRNDVQTFDFRVFRSLLDEAVMERGCWYAQEYLAGDDDIWPATQLGVQRLMRVRAEQERKDRERSKSDLALVNGSGGGGVSLSY
jgi:hypothetical protein